MLRFFNWRLLMVWLGLTVGMPSASAFSLWGTKEGYQADNLGYNRVTETDYEDIIYFILSAEFTFAPHNLAEEYRWSVPTLYYAYDASFIGTEYFGSNGVHAVDSAFAILNALTNVSSYSADLSEFPLNEARFNYTAQALHLFDLKSAALEMLVGRLGLADPERFTWTIRSRSTTPLPCPFYTYRIIQRNFDPVTFEPTRYVNGNLFTYIINQHCPPDYDRVEAEKFLIDPLGTYETAVASPKITFPTVMYYGMFHSGLTRDDVGGLRYLYRTNNMNVEMAPPEAILFQTNFLTSQLLFTSNLTLLVNQALTNNAAALQALYPNLVIANTTPIFTNIVSTNVFAYFTNYPWSPAGFATLAFQTNLATNIVTWFSHTFANVVTNYPFHYTTGYVSILTTNIAPQPFGSPQVLYTNVSVSAPFATNFVNGEYFILPANAACGVSIIHTQLTWLTTFTNTPAVATNAVGVTNGNQFSQSTLFYITNHAYVINPVDCVTNSVALRQGLEKISFVRRDFDSLVERFFYPITNTYTMRAITNNQLVLQTFQRIVTRPDVLIAATDGALTAGPDVDTVDHANSSPLLNNGNAIAGLAGPGTIEGPMTLTFNKVGPVWLNSSPFFITEQNSIFYYNWASFDGSTNAPIIYPNSTSIHDIESQLLIQVSPPSVPAARVGTGYNVAFSVTGGQAPYSWTNSPGSPALPDGLALTQMPGNGSQATLSGTPTTAGTSDFWIRLTDAGSRFVDTFYVLRIDP